MIRDFFKLLFLLALAYAGWQFYSTGKLTNPFSGEGSAYSSSKNREISNGERVELQSSAMKGGVTLYYFTASWSAPCKLFGPDLTQYVSAHPGVGLRKIDIKSYDSPVAKQHGIRSVPQVWVANSSGQIVARVLEPKVGAVDAAVKPLLPRR